MTGHQIFSGKVGDVFGPYNEAGFFKITKVVDVVKMPDSVKSSHILVPFVGSRAAAPTTTKTEEEAKKSIDSIFNLLVVRTNLAGVSYILFSSINFFYCCSSYIYFSIFSS